MSDDNVVRFPGLAKNVTFVESSQRIVLVITPDGIKRRAADRIPLAALDRTELLTVIDELCDVIARRG